MSRTALVTVVLAFGGWSGVAAQQATFIPVDRVVAVVGDVAIPLSRVDEQINILRARGAQVPTDSAGLQRMRREIVERIVDDELLVQQALGDTAISITDTDLQTAVDDAMRQVRQQFRSDVDLERQLRASGFASVEEYRRWLTDQQRRDLLQDALVRKLGQEGKLRQVQPTQSELRAFFDRVIEQQPPRPASVSFRQIVVQPRPDSSALRAARHLADSLVIALRGGADFAQVARRFSDDPASKEQGGDLGWFRRGQMTPAFEDAAFRLRPGYISNPVPSPYGFHIIQVQRADPAEVQARHILIAPTITETNAAAARAQADSLAALLRRGASFDSLLRLHHDPNEESFAENMVQDSLPSVYREAMAGAQPGDVIGPIVLPRPGDRLRFAVVRLEDRREAGRYTFEELRERIRSQVTRESALRRYLDGLRERTHVDIRLH